MLSVISSTNKKDCNLNGVEKDDQYTTATYQGHEVLVTHKDKTRMECGELFSYKIPESEFQFLHLGNIPYEHAHFVLLQNDISTKNVIMQ